MPGPAERLGRLLVLSKSDFIDYEAASYQRDFLEALGRAKSISFYGPGFPEFDPLDTMGDVRSKVGFCPDTILVAHMWLSDNFVDPIDPMPHLGLRNFAGRKIGILNKEYSRIAEKRAWFDEHHFHIVWSHHPQAEEFSSKIVDYHFLPFGVRANFLEGSSSEKPIDLGFTGLLRNPLFPEQQSDFRERVMRDIFLTIGDLPVHQKRRWSHRTVSWRSWSGSRVSNAVARRVRARRKLTASEYPREMAKAKSWLNSPSPAGILSTRYLENAVCETVIITEAAPGLERIISQDSFFVVRTPGELLEVVDWVAENESSRSRLVRALRNEVLGAHLWDHRVATLLYESI